MKYNKPFSKISLPIDAVTKEYVDAHSKGIDWNWMMKMKERKHKIEKIMERNEQE